jgi:ankyrin repeat protein
MDTKQEEDEATADGQQLLDACDIGNMEGVRFLVSASAGVINYQCKLDGNTPAIRCCIHGQTEILTYLIERGADADMTASDGRTPLHFAVDNNSSECVALLLHHGVNAGRATNYGVCLCILLIFVELYAAIRNFVAILHRLHSDCTAIA